MNVDIDTQKLISETIDNFIKKGSRPESYDICSHCKTEISEHKVYSDDGGKTIRHSECGNLIEFPDTTEIPNENIAAWLRPYIDQVKQESATDAYPQDKEMMDLSGEAKYSKQQPGGQMQATGLIETQTPEDKTEEVIIDSMDYIKMFDGQVRTVNLANIPLKFKIIKITRDTADAFILQISNA